MTLEDISGSTKRFCKKYSGTIAVGLCYLAGILTTAVLRIGIFSPVKHSEEVSFQVNKQPIKIVREKGEYFGLCDGERILERRLWVDDGRLIIFDRGKYFVMPPKYHYANRNNKDNEEEQR